MTCHCGCNQPATRTFLPGHDQRLRCKLERRVGGLLNLETLVHQTEALLAGTLTPEAFQQAIAPLLSAALEYPHGGPPMLDLELQPETEARITADAQRRGFLVA